MLRLAVAGSLALAVALLGFGAYTTYAEEKPAPRAESQALYQCPMHPEVQATWQADCPKCGMDLQKVEPSEKTAKALELCRRTMKAHSGAGRTNPDVLLALGKELKLTEEQSARLQSILRKARREAEATLDKEQKEALSELADPGQCPAGTAAGMMMGHGAMMMQHATNMPEAEVSRADLPCEEGSAAAGGAPMAGCCAP